MCKLYRLLERAFGAVSVQETIADPLNVQSISFPIDPLGVDGVQTIQVTFSAAGTVVVSFVEVLGCRKPLTTPGAFNRR